MQYKFVNIDGINLAYLEKNNNHTNIIFFIHGNSTSAKAWNKQLNSKELSKYRLIAFDLPAHGESDPLNKGTPNYSLPDLGKILAKAIQQISGTASYILSGVSLGTNIIAEALTHDLRPAGIVLTGSCVIGGEFTLENIFKRDIDLHAGFSDSVSEKELKEYSKLAFSSTLEKDWLDFASDYYKVKDSFRSKMFATVSAGNYSNEIELLRRPAVPILVIFGADEKVCEPRYLDNAGLKLWSGQSFKIKKAGHFVNTDQPEVFNKLFGDFAGGVFK